MVPDLLVALGGLGLFLLGMVIMTDGLKGLAGEALRRLLARFTRSPASGALAGAATTAVIQSSGATIVTAIGFVGAGLMTFPQALEIVFGANIGTTMTGWLVALIGFKLKLGTLALPLLLLGVLLRLFGPGRWRHVGWSLAGFSLLFIGIDAMREGLAVLEGVVTPGSFPGDSLWGRLQLVAIGFAMTLITQSSSAGVAATLVALSAGAVSLPQGAAMVIGMDVAGTAPAALAAIGGTRAARQTAWSHILYNVLTAGLAFLLLPLYIGLAESWAAEGSGDRSFALVAFHSGYNILGVLLILPFAIPFAHLIDRLVPERASPLLRLLDKRLLSDAAAACDAAQATLAETAKALEAYLLQAMPLAPKSRQRLNQSGQQALQPIGCALDQSEIFIRAIRLPDEEAALKQRLEAVFHALDHLQRLHHRCGQGERIAALGGDRSLKRLAGLLAATLTHEPKDDRLERLTRLYRAKHQAYRTRTIAAAIHGEIDDETALLRLDAMRWLLRVSDHLWRAWSHLQVARPPSTAAVAAATSTT